MRDGNDTLGEAAGRAPARAAVAGEGRAPGAHRAAVAGLAMAGLALVALVALARAGVPASVFARGTNLFEPVVVELEVRGAAVGGVDITPADRDLDALIAALAGEVPPSDQTVRHPLPVRAQLMTDALAAQLDVAVTAIDPTQLTDDLALALRLASVHPDEPPGPHCRPARGAAACTDPASYCDDADRRCHRRVPVIVTPATADRLRRGIAAGVPGGVVRELARADGGPLMLALGPPTRPSNCAPAPLPLRVGVVVVGVSWSAAEVGITVPSGHAAAWGRAVTGADELRRRRGTVTVKLAHRYRAMALVERLRPLRWVEVNAITPALPGPPAVAGAAMHDTLARIDGITTDLLLESIRRGLTEDAMAPLPPVPCERDPT